MLQQLADPSDVRGGLAEPAWSKMPLGFFWGGFSGERFEELLKQIDTDGDGFIQLEEDATSS